MVSLYFRTGYGWIWPINMLGSIWFHGAFAAGAFLPEPFAPGRPGHPGPARTTERCRTSGSCAGDRTSTRWFNKKGENLLKLIDMAHHGTRFTRFTNVYHDI